MGQRRCKLNTIELARIVEAQPVFAVFGCKDKHFLSIIHCLARNHHHLYYQGIVSSSLNLSEANALLVKSSYTHTSYTWHLTD